MKRQIFYPCTRWAQKLKRFSLNSFHFSFSPFNQKSWQKDGDSTDDRSVAHGLVVESGGVILLLSCILHKITNLCKNKESFYLLNSLALRGLLAFTETPRGLKAENLMDPSSFLSSFYLATKVKLSYSKKENKGEIFKVEILLNEKRIRVMSSSWKVCLQRKDFRQTIFAKRIFS